MLYAIVLICGLSTPHLNCDETTAHRYERVPGGNELPFMCQRSAEIWAAEPIKAGEMSRRTATPAAALFFFDLPQACYAQIA